MEVFIKFLEVILEVTEFVIKLIIIVEVIEIIWMIIKATVEVIMRKLWSISVTVLSEQ